MMPVVGLAVRTLSRMENAWFQRARVKVRQWMWLCLMMQAAKTSTQVGGNKIQWRHAPVHCTAKSAHSIPTKASDLKSWRYRRGPRLWEALFMMIHRFSGDSPAKSLKTPAE